VTAGPVRPWQAAKPCNCATTTDRDAEIARMESMPDAPESLRERVARALFHTEDAAGDWQYFGENFRDHYRYMADAALAVITTPTEVAP
jgi:hypothetical protein